MDNHIYFQALKKTMTTVGGSTSVSQTSGTLLQMSCWYRKELSALVDISVPQGRTTRETQSTGIVILIKGGQRRNAFK